MYDNYIFDLYGTLVDIHTNENKRTLWKYMAQYMAMQGAAYAPAELRKAYYKQIDVQRLKQYEALKGKFAELTLEEIEVDLKEVFRALYETKGVTPTAEMLAHWAMMYRTVSLEYVRLFDGAKELLMELRRRGKRVYLLSNAQRLFTEPELHAVGIYELFDDVFISSEIGFMKPSAQFYGALLEKYGLDKKRSVMIGNDWRADAWGAHNNGLASMYVHTAQSPEVTGELPPDCRRLSCIGDVL